MDTPDFSGLRALFINCTLKRSPEVSHTEGLVDVSAAIMLKHGVGVEVVRAVDRDIATGVYLDMTEHGWASDAWPDIHRDVMAVRHPRAGRPDLARRQLQRDEEGHRAAVRRVEHPQRRGPVRLLRPGRRLPDHRQRGRHQALRENVLYSLQHIGYSIPPQADAGWIGEAGPGPSYLDPGSGGPENDFTNRNTTFMTWNLMHLASCSRTPAGSRRTATSARSGTPAHASTSRTRSTASLRA